MKFKKIDCAICGRNSTKKLFGVEDYRLNTTSREFNLVFCRNCGLSYINPQPKEEELDKFYPLGYYNPTLPILEIIYSPVAKMVFRRMVNDIKKIKGKGKILDIGCGSGIFLAELLKYGYDAYGIDSYKGISDIIPPALQSRVKNNSFLDIEFPEDFFDIVIMKQVLEHLPNPNDIIREIHRILKKDGFIYMEVPNFNCIEARLFGKFWYNLEIPRHLYQFSKKNLTAIFIKHGFQPFLELNGSGFLLFKSPLAVVNSFRFFVRNKISLSLMGKLIELICFLPLAIITPLLRLIPGKGMDIRMVFKKN